MLLVIAGFLGLPTVTTTGAAEDTCLDPPAGMTGWWPGDGNTDDIIGIPPHNATLTGDASYSGGLVGDAFALDGDGDFVSVAHDPALNVGNGDFTIDLWVYFNTTAGEQILVEKYVENFTQTPPGWTLTKLSDNRLAFGSGPGPTLLVSAPLLLPPATWIHVAARRRAGVGAVFVNGSQVASGPLAYDASSSSSLKFGHRGSPSDTPGSLDNRQFDLNGRIDEVELFLESALSVTKIGAIHDAGSAGKCRPRADIDVKPRSDPSCFNSDGHGAIPVAILSSASFDATQVDPATLDMDGQAVRVRGNKLQAHIEDSNGDGLLDLVVQFEDDGVYPPGDGTATVSGETFGGAIVFGQSDICIVPG